MLLAMALVSPSAASPEMVTWRDWLQRVMVCGDMTTLTSAMLPSGTLPPVGVEIAMERRASRLSSARPSPRTTTSTSLLSMVTVAAVVPVRPERTAAATL